MRILIMADSLIAGGMERQVVELLKGLKAHGQYSVVLGVLDRGGQLEAEACCFAETVLPLRRSTRFDFTVPWMLGQQVKTYNVDLIHAYGGMSSLAALVVTRRFRLPLVVSIRNAPLRLSSRQRLTALCGRLANSVVSNSRAGLVSYGLEDHHCARVIPNGVDTRSMVNVVPVRHRANERVLCMVANFSPLKDQATVVHAVATLCQEWPVRLVLVGRDRGTLGDVQRLVFELGISHVVDFVTDTNYPHPYVAASEVCVLATNVALHGEGISNAILEYMTLAKPVVATDCGGNSEVISDGVTGYLVPTDAPNAFADRIAELLRMPQQATRMGQLGRERVQSEFCLERMVSSHESLYAFLMRQKR